MQSLEERSKETVTFPTDSLEQSSWPEQSDNACSHDLDPAMNWQLEVDLPIDELWLNVTRSNSDELGILADPLPSDGAVDWLIDYQDFGIHGPTVVINSTRNLLDHPAGKFTEEVLYEDVASDQTLPRTESIATPPAATARTIFFQVGVQTLSLFFDLGMDGNERKLIVTDEKAGTARKWRRSGEARDFTGFIKMTEESRGALTLYTGSLLS
ncbi:hypothetical protein PR202_gb28106 [Eleusine coracana subsp. coracana]|uniref:Uncharacterized protein n=1 Tax=Eleusine coracana subsp. coracana TaxID=191504 RepID=A0AAV5FY02_ELECO|nr:hypothetical protein PR202_gb28106 [Eleusine coracana subsp. coracana]